MLVESCSVDVFRSCFCEKIDEMDESEKFEDFRSRSIDMEKDFLFVLPSEEILPMVKLNRIYYPNLIELYFVIQRSIQRNINIIVFVHAIVISVFSSCFRH